MSFLNLSEPFPVRELAVYFGVGAASAILQARTTSSEVLPMANIVPNYFHLTRHIPTSNKDLKQ